MSGFDLALVTGASSGIGKQLCRLFADQGIDLIITARNTERLTALAEELREKVDVIVCPADLTYFQLEVSIGNFSQPLPFT